MAEGGTPVALQARRLGGFACNFARYPMLFMELKGVKGFSKHDVTDTITQDDFANGPSKCSQDNLAITNGPHRYISHGVLCFF